MTTTPDPTKEYLAMPECPPELNWKPVTHPKVAPGHYQVSAAGQVMGNNSGTILRSTFREGVRHLYLSVKGRNKGKNTSIPVAALVLHEHGPVAPKGMTSVGYRDGDPTNCHIDNLEWVKRTAARHPARRTTKKKISTTPSRPAPQRSTPVLEVLRVYRLQGVTATVADDGGVLLELRGHRIKLTATQVAALAVIMPRIQEMTDLLALRSL
jgi:hypothetical protein